MSGKKAHSGSGKTAARARWWTLLAALAICASIAIYQHRRSDDAESDNGGAAEIPTPAVLRQVTDDPAQDGWTTEQWSQRAQQQLDVIAHAITDAAPMTADASRLVVDDFEGESWRPADRRAVFDEPPFRVERASQALPTKPFAGPNGFADALRELVAPYQGADSVRVKIKLFRIEMKNQEFVTREFVSIAATVNGQRVEENSTWHSTWTVENPPRLKSLGVEDYERATATKTEPLLVDCTASVLGPNLSQDDRLVFGTPDWWSKIPSHFGVGLHGHFGLAVGDVNGDGLDDVYVCQPSRIPNQLLLQNADGTVTDRSVEAGVDWLNPTPSALILDIDNDGDQDLVLGMIGVITVMENDGTGKFDTQSVLQAPNSGQGIKSIAAADYDRDGDLDIYACYMTNEIPIRVHDANNGMPNVLWRNDGKGEFNDVTRECGLDENNLRFSFAACWEDYDNDGDPDLYVANDFGRNNLYENTDGRFKDVAASVGVEDIAAGMSVSFGDYNLDGQLDLYVGNMFSSAGNRITVQPQFNPGAQNTARSVFQRHARGNSLFKSLGDGTFADVSEQAGVTMGRWAWCSRFVDLNNDRWEDICVVNGFLTNAKPHDL